MKFLLFFLLPFSLFGSKILSYNIYDRTDRVDVMITFDTPYNGTVKQSRRKSKIVIKLENATIEAAKTKKISSKFLKSLTVTPFKNRTEIVALIPKSVKLFASKTADGYGLRLRFANSSTNKNRTIQKSIQTENSLSSLPTKKDESLTKSYIIVITILIIGIIILFYIKKRVSPLQTKEKNNKIYQKTPWLFNANHETKKEKTTLKNEVTIRFQKQINKENSVIMLDFGNSSYLVLMGKNNILLDKFYENRPKTQKEFESILQNRHEELENFLTNNENRQEKEPLQAYKERAASILYSDENNYSS